MFKLENLKKINTGFLILIVILCIIGGLTVFSTTYFPERSASKAFFNQVLFYIFGIVTFFGLSSLNYKKLNNKFFILSLFSITVLSLIAVLAFGEYVFDAKRWVNIGPFTLQPSELTKVAIIIITAFALSFKEKVVFEKIFNIYEIKRGSFLKNIKDLIHSEQFLRLLFSIFTLIIFAVLVMLQKSLGNTLLITLIYLIIIFMSTKINAKFIGVLIAIFLGINISFKIIDLVPESPINFAGYNLIVLIVSIVGIVLITKITKLKIFIPFILFILFALTRPVLDFTYNNVLENYQRNRIETFLNPDPSIQLSDDYNRRQSINAIGSGKLFGQGFLNGNIVKLNLLPFAFTDFAFAAYAEQFGFFGSVILLVLYFTLLYKIIKIGKNSKDSFGEFIAYGVAAMIFLNTAQHIGMNIGLLPITGVPLPLISSGGSAILTVFIGLGLVQSIEIKNEEEEEEVTNFAEDFGVKNKFY